MDAPVGISISKLTLKTSGLVRRKAKSAQKLQSAQKLTELRRNRGFRAGAVGPWHVLNTHFIRKALWRKYSFRAILQISPQNPTLGLLHIMKSLFRDLLGIFFSLKEQAGCWRDICIVSPELQPLFPDKREAHCSVSLIWSSQKTASGKKIPSPWQQHCLSAFFIFYFFFPLPLSVPQCSLF